MCRPPIVAGLSVGRTLRAAFDFVRFLENVSRNLERVGTLKSSLDGMKQDY